MDFATIFALVNSLFSDDPKTGCDTIEPCVCKNDPVTQIQCSYGPEVDKFPSFSKIHSRKLTNIDLSGLDIQSFSSSKPFNGATISPTGVKMSLSDTGLTTFDSNFFEGISETFESLDLRNNRITSIQHFDNFDNLEYLNLQNNRFTKFPSLICNAPKLKYVNLRYNLVKNDWSDQVNSLIKCNSLKKVYTDARKMTCSCDKLKHYFYYHDRGLPLYRDEGGTPMTCSSESAFLLSGRPVNTLTQREVCNICDCVEGNSRKQEPSFLIVFTSMSMLISICSL